VPAIDTLRRRVSVSDDQLEVLRLHTAGEAWEQHAAELTHLVTAGLIDTDGEVHPLVLDLVAAHAQPLLELWVETSGPQGLALSHVVVRGDETVWYTDPWPGEVGGERLYVRDELPQLIWILARLVGWRRATPPRGTAPLTTTLGRVAALMTAFALEDGTSWSDTRTVAVARADELLGRLEPEQRSLWIAVLAHLEGSWRVTCAWGPGVEHSRALAVWDCGSGGFWVRTTPAEPITEQTRLDAEATFVPTSGADVWSALTDLLPSKAELQAVRQAAGQPAGQA
jgi:hypothetical protein